MTSKLDENTEAVKSFNLMLNDYKFIKYPKINTLFQRDDKGKIIKDQYSCPEFDLIKYWSVEEKIDGTNIRIHFNGEKVFFGGRTDRADIPKHLLAYLKSVFTIDKFKEIFNAESGSNVTLFGEGYGHKIQEPMGSAYAGNDVGFCLFDVKVGHWWLERSNCEGIANNFSVKMPTTLGEFRIEDILLLFNNDGLNSPLALKNNCSVLFEGIIARTNPILLDRSGERIIWKLKVRDFK